MDQTILCLANSIKNRNHCVAGRSILMDSNRIRIGKWVRPVGRGAEGALLDHEARYDNHNNLHPGEVASFSSKRNIPLLFQPENRLIEPGSHWKKYNLPEIEPLLRNSLEKPESLWDHIPGARQDRLPESSVGNGLKQSLYFIQAQSLEIEHTASFNGYPQIRAHFHYNGKKYNLVITDPDVKQQYTSIEKGIHTIKSSTNCGLCISLGMPFYGYHYKLVASIIPLSNHTHNN